MNEHIDSNESNTGYERDGEEFTGDALPFDEDEPEPECTCYYIDVDLVDSTFCPLHGV